MKTTYSKALVVALSSVAITTIVGCSSSSKTFDYSQNNTEYIVYEAVDGNTIKLDNSLTVDLLGIADSPRSYNFLKQEVVGKKVRLYADSKHKDYYEIASKETVLAHVRMVVNNNQSVALNGQMLLRGDAKYSPVPHNDSIRLYKEYAEREPSVEMTDEQLCLHMTPATFLIECADHSIGTGFFISDDGLALTNNHVIEYSNNPDFYTVYLSDEKGNISQTNKRRVSRILYTDPANDFTIFRVQLDPNESSPCLFVSRREPLRGEHVGVVGNPRGLLATFSTGEFSAFREYNTIQFTAPVYQGNSGGPICDKRGVVIGIVKSIAAERDGSNATGNMNFGVDIRYVRSILDQIDDIKCYYGK